MRARISVRSNLSNTDLRGATLSYGKLTGANFTGADVRGARLSQTFTYPGSGISISQLASTASYQAHDLSGIGLGGNNLAGVNLAGQNLTNADFESALHGANLNGADLSHANLINARLGNSTLTGATLVGATLAKLDLHLTEFGNANLSVANLSGLHFGGYVIVESGGEEGGGGYYNFPGSNLIGANLARANFAGTLDFFGAPSPGANLTDANLTRGRRARSKFCARHDDGRQYDQFMRKPLSRSEQDDRGTSQASIRRHPRWHPPLRTLPRVDPCRGGRSERIESGAKLCPP